MKKRMLLVAAVLIVSSAAAAFQTGASSDQIVRSSVESDVVESSLKGAENINAMLVLQMLPQ